MAPVTRYTRSGDASIAYQVAGEGRLDLLFMTGWISQVEQLWEAAGAAPLPRAARRVRAPDPVRPPRHRALRRRRRALHARAGGAGRARRARRRRLRARRAVHLRARRPRRRTLLAAEHPERVGALIMYASIARTLWAPDYDWAMTREERVEWLDRTSHRGATPTTRACPRAGAVDGRRPGADRAGSRACSASRRARATRAAARPPPPTSTCASCCRGSACRRSSCTAPATPPGTRATRATSPSTSPARATSSSRAPTRCPFLGDSDAIVEEIEEFLTGGRAGGERHARAADRDVHRHRRRHRARRRSSATAAGATCSRATTRSVRKELARFDGREVKTVGDGFLATFDGPPSRALRCALARATSSRSRLLRW